MSYSTDELKRIFDRTGGKCFYCGKQLVLANHGKDGALGAWEVDHFIPESKGGASAFSNLVPACIPCNQAKGDQMPWEFDPKKFKKNENDPKTYL